MRTIAMTTTDSGSIRFLDEPRTLAERRLLRAFACSALFFMLVPGTLVGVLNLISISADHTPAAVSRAWVQAHGHAQIFGWLGTLIIGIGYASLPQGRRRTIFGVDDGWASLALWTSGVLIRWSVGFSTDGWRFLLPLGAALELAGFALFFRASAGHRPAGGARPRAWAAPVIGGTAGLLLTLVVHVWLAFRQAIAGDSPAFPAEPDARLLALALWAFLAPFVWGFTARWVCPLLGLVRVRDRALLAAYGLSVVGVGLVVCDLGVSGAVILIIASACAAYALRLFEPADRETKASAARSHFRIFARLAYVWLFVGAGLSVWAALEPAGSGIVGAARHALTVGFLATMVFTVGPRVLPALAGARKLFRPGLGTLALTILTVGCATRVVAQILAYQGYAAGAWSWLPVSAVTELTAFTAFFANLATTLVTARR